MGSGEFYPCGTAKRRPAPAPSGPALFTVVAPGPNGFVARLAHPFYGPTTALYSASNTSLAAQTGRRRPR